MWFPKTFLWLVMISYDLKKNANDFLWFHTLSYNFIQFHMISIALMTWIWLFYEFIWFHNVLGFHRISCVLFYDFVCVHMISYDFICFLMMFVHMIVIWFLWFRMISCDPVISWFHKFPNGFHIIVLKNNLWFLHVFMLSYVY